MHEPRHPGWRRGLGLTLLAALSCSPPEPEQLEPITGATVERVIDGDTVALLIGDTTERVRLLGVDAPESVAPHVPEQCYGAEASQALAELLPEGTPVRVERDREGRDRYERLLLYLYRASDDLFVNRWLVESGYAEATSYEPNVTHETELEQAEQAAKASGVGLWGWCEGPDQPLQ